MIPSAALACVIVLMLAELAVARRNERFLIRNGAIAAPDPVYRTMRWAYPAVFAAMAVEGAFRGGTPGVATLAGAVIFTLSKMLKYWAIASLGRRWSYRVLVLPGAPLVADGPYRFMRHPNYVGVVGELVGVAVGVGAPLTGIAGLAFFSSLLRRRIRDEERALGL